MPHGLHILPKMNSLNIITARVSPSATPAPSRTNSLGSLSLAVTSEDDNVDREPSDRAGGSADGQNARAAAEGRNPLHDDHGNHNSTEETPLLGDHKEVGSRTSSWHLVPKRLATTILNSLRWVLSTLAAPGVYLIACFYDEHGNFAPLVQLKKLFGIYRGNPRKLAAEYNETAIYDEKDGRPTSDVTSSSGYSGVAAMRQPHISGSSSSGLSESESDAEQKGDSNRAGSSSRQARGKPLQNSEEIVPSRRSIRIKLHSDDALQQRKQRKSQSLKAKNSGDGNSQDISAQLKSPTSPVAALTKYPKTPAPPRPLIPRRTASYLNLDPLAKPPQKTLILDLDETLIHSMSKGGRMSTGHMVEVNLKTTFVGASGQTSPGPQHPILYYVHKRPHCDDFLRRVRNKLLGRRCLGGENEISNGASRCASGTTSSYSRLASKSMPTLSSTG
jgi:CTD nuclear envelope phosphatase 1